MGKIKASFYLSFMVTIVGIFILSYSVFTIFSYIYNYKHYEQLDGLIIGHSNINDKKSMVITYTVDGTNYKINSTYTTEDIYPIGFNIIVRYDKNHPERYILGDEELNYNMTIIGGIVSLVGICGTITTFPSGKKNKELKGDK